MVVVAGLALQMRGRTWILPEKLQIVVGCRLPTPSTAYSEVMHPVRMCLGPVSLLVFRLYNCPLLE